MVTLSARVRITPPTDVKVGAPANFIVTMSGESAAGLTLDFGDGTRQDLGSLRKGSIVVVHVYQAAGRYALTAILVDSAGATVTVSAPVYVNESTSTNSQ